MLLRSTLLQSRRKLTNIVAWIRNTGHWAWKRASRNLSLKKLRLDLHSTKYSTICKQPYMKHMWSAVWYQLMKLSSPWSEIRVEWLRTMLLNPAVALLARTMLQLHAEKQPDVWDGESKQETAPHAIGIVSENRKGTCSLLMGLFLWHDRRQALCLTVARKKVLVLAFWRYKTFEESLRFVFVSLSKISWRQSHQFHTITCWFSMSCDQWNQRHE